MIRAGLLSIALIIYQAVRQIMVGQLSPFLMF